MCESPEEDIKLLNCLSLLSTCGQAFIQTLPSIGSLTVLTSPTSSLSLLKSQFSSSLPSLSHYSLTYCGVSVLYQITALLIEDHALTGHYSNCLSYLDLTLASLQCLPTTGSLYLCVEYLSKARDSLKRRIRNINNKQIDTDRIKRFNFLNRVEQLDQAMVALREVLLVSIMRQHSRAKGDQLDCYRGRDVLDTSSSSCDQDSPVLTRRVLNNNTLAMQTGLKTPEKKLKDGLPGLIGKEDVVAAVTSLLAESSVAASSSVASSSPSSDESPINFN